MRTFPHSKYISPHDVEVNRRLKELNFTKEYQVNEIRDIAHTASHFLKNSNTTGIFPNSNSDSREDTVFKDFLRTVDFKKITGTTPLEKAVNLMLAITANSDGSDSSGSAEGEQKKEKNKSPQTSSIFSSGKSGEQIAKDIESQIEALKKTSELDDSFIYRKAGDSTEQTLRKLSTSEIAQLVAFADVSKISGMRFYGDTPDIQVSQMEEYAQVTRLHTTSDFVHPAFELRLLTKSLFVQKIVSPSERALVLLMDLSGSMKNEIKVNYARAILAEMLIPVVEKKAILYFSFFLNGLIRERMVKLANKEDSQKFLRSLNINTFGGGDTDVQRAVTESIAIFDKNSKWGSSKVDSLKPPEIVVINDGQDIVNPEYSPRVKTHAIVLGTSNDDLRQLVKNSGGTYTEFAIS